MSKNNLTVNTKTEHISLHEAAEKLGMTYNSLGYWLKRNPLIKTKYCFKAQYRGRLKTVIKVEALPVIANMKDVGGKSDTISHFRNFKKGLAEKAVEQAEKGVTIEQLHKSIKKMETFDQRIAELEGDISKMALTTQQRKHIHERVNAIHYFLKEKGQDIPQQRIYKTLHSNTGCKSIADYRFEDYTVARRVLKEWFKKLNMPW